MSCPVFAVISLPVHDGSSIFMMDPNLCHVAANWLGDEESLRQGRFKGSLQDDMGERVEWLVLWATWDYCCHCLSLWLSVLASYRLPFTSSWAGGASSPQYTATYQPDAASAHSPPPLFIRFLPSASPLYFPPYVERQINNSLKSLHFLSF